MLKNIYESKSLRRSDEKWYQILNFGLQWPPKGQKMYS